MLARCAHCQKTFGAERYGVQTCPHCGSDVMLADPSAPPPAAPPSTAAATGAAPPQPPPGAWGAPPPPPGAAWSAPPGGGSGPPGGWGPLPPGAAPPPGGDGDSAPFAERQRLGFATAFAQTWKLAALEPTRFFRQVKVSRPASAVLFGVVAFTLGRTVEILFGYLTSSASLNVLQRVLPRLPRTEGIDPELLSRWAVGATAGGVLANVLASPIVGLVVVYLAAALFHLVLLVFKGAPRGFDATLTVVGYASGLALLLALPGCGSPVYLVWFAVVAIVGLGEAQRCGSGKAAVAVLAPAILLCACACVGLGSFVAAVSGVMKHG